MRSPAVAVIALLLALLTGPTPASAQQDTGVGVTPARFEVDLNFRAHDFAVSVFNDTSSAEQIQLDVVDLGHGLDGNPIFGEPLAGLVEIVGERRFVLAPGESRSVRLQADFPDLVALYGALVVGRAPDDPSAAIAVRTQVASIFLLRGPQPWDQALEIRDVGIDDQEVGTEARLWVDLENVGDAHVRPSGTLVVRQDGQQVAEVDIVRENILPGWARRLIAPWVPDRDLSGVVEVTVQLDDGTRHTTTVDLADVPERVAQQREAQGESTQDGGAVFDGGAAERGDDASVDPGPAQVVAALLLAITALLTLLAWRRRRTEEEDEAEASAGSLRDPIDGPGTAPDDVVEILPDREHVG